MQILKTMVYLDKSKCKKCQYVSSCCYVNTEINTVTNSKNVDVLIVGQGAGKDENINLNKNNVMRQPFFGRSGKYLRHIIKYIWNNGTLFNVAFSNNVRFHPQDVNGKDRAPTPEEIQGCIHHLYDDITLINPGVILTVGLNSTCSFFPYLIDYSMGVIRSTIRNITINGISIKTIATYHPSFLLRQYGKFEPTANNEFDNRFIDDLNVAIKTAGIV